MRHLLAAALLALTACPSDDVPAEPDGGGIDAAPGACHFSEEGIRVTGAAPTGTFSIEWACQGGCGDDEMLPAPALTAATSMTISAGMLTWTGPSGTIEQTPVTADGACWVSAAADTECRSAFRLCLATDGVLRANPVIWYDIAKDWGQRWRVDEI